LALLKTIYSKGRLLGDRSNDGWGVSYQQGDFNMTSDSKLFPTRTKWEADGYLPDEYGHWLKGAWRPYFGPTNVLDRDPGIVLSRDKSQAIQVSDIQGVALPLNRPGIRGGSLG
jgi:hypothetical protein